VTVGSLEKRIEVQRVELYLSSLKQTLDEIAPPPFVVVLARRASRGAHRHFFPNLGKAAIQRGGIQGKPLLPAHEGVMLSNAFR
jgi:hypothetical protein